MTQSHPDEAFEKQFSTFFTAMYEGWRDYRTLAGERDELSDIVWCYWRAFSATATSRTTPTVSQCLTLHVRCCRAAATFTEISPALLLQAIQQTQLDNQRSVKERVRAVNALQANRSPEN